MESKKFVNLSAEYRNFLTSCEKNKDLSLIDGSTTFSDIYLIYKKVEKDLFDCDLQISDINHLVTNYSKTNEQVEKLKKLIYYKNYYIITNSLRTEEWKKFINSLKTKCPDTKTKYIEQSVIKLLEKYMGTWNTVENIIVIDKKGLIKKIELVDPDDYDFIFNNLVKK